MKLRVNTTNWLDSSSRTLRNIPKPPKMEIESDAEDDDVEDDPWENGLEKVDNVHCSMNWIPEIEAEGHKLRFFDDQAFVQQMVEEPFYLETVRELFDNAKNHVVQQFDKAKQSVIMTITRELSRRVEGCCCLADEIASGSYPLDVILKAEGEIQTTAFILQPFVLKDEEIEEKKDLRLSHFYMLTTQCQKVVEAGEAVIVKRLNLEAEVGDEQDMEDEQTSDDMLPPQDSQGALVALSPPKRIKK